MDQTQRGASLPHLLSVDEATLISIVRSCSQDQQAAIRLLAEVLARRTAAVDSAKLYPFIARK